MTLHVTAPAKINWTLEVLGRREDGYHEVRTVLQAIDLCDEVVLRRADATRLTVTGAHSASEDDHTLLAARLLGEAVGRELPAEIHAYKQIPVGAGLGGGSSDAAALLRGLNTLYGLGLTRDRLAEVAAGVGSDAPFFLYGGACLAEGRGERVTPLPDEPEVWLALLVPPIAVPEKTRQMYGALREEDFTDGERTSELAERLEAGAKVRGAMLFNAFERAAGEVFPGLDGCREALRAAGAEQVHLSGAGPGLFALCGSREEAEGVVSRVRAGAARVLVARTLGRGEEE